MKFYNYLLIVLFSCSVLAQGDDTFEKANSAYADDEFEQAVKLYDSVLADGFVSAELYFNLGNAYFNQNDLANAIYHYEKALQYNPSDQDIQENLEIANTQTIDKIEDVPESNLNSLIYNITHAMTLNSWGWLSIILSVLFGVFMVLYFRSSATKGKRRNFFDCHTSCCVGCCKFAFLAVFKMSSRKNNPTLLFSKINYQLM